MRRNHLLWIFLAALFGLALVVFFLARREPPPPDTAARDQAVSPQRMEPARSAARWTTLDTQRRKELRRERDALRTLIVNALASAPVPVAAEPLPAAKPVARDAAPRPPGNLVDRIGGRNALAAQLNKDFMPLADECIELVQEQQPALSGMLVLGIETVADKELGAVVEQAEPAPSNAVSNRELLECIRETALSLRLPPPPGSGREKFEISLRIDPKPTPPADR